MKKSAGAQHTSNRPIRLVISEKGAITDDLGARTRTKNILTKMSSANTYISFCKAKSCFRREEASPLPSQLVQILAGFEKNLDKRSQEFFPTRHIKDRKVLESQPWYPLNTCYKFVTHKKRAMKASLPICFKHNGQYRQLFPTPYKPHNDSQ